MWIDSLAWHRRATRFSVIAFSAIVADSAVERQTPSKSPPGPQFVRRTEFRSGMPMIGRTDRCPKWERDLSNVIR